MKRSYEEVAVFPLVKPRSWLNVKFRWSMISTLRSNFPTEPARGHTMGTPEDSPRMGCTHLNSRWRVLIFRVQLVSFGLDKVLHAYVSARNALGFPLVSKTFPERTRSTNSAATKGAKRTLHHGRYVSPASWTDFTIQWCGLRWAMHTKGTIAPLRSIVVTGYSATPHTHTHVTGPKRIPCTHTPTIVRTLATGKLAHCSIGLG